MTAKKEFLKIHYEGLLNSYAVVFFSKNRLFSFILLVVSFFDPVAGISGLLSVVTANLVAGVLGFNRFNITSGFYGFNALLAGIGLGIYFQLTLELLILLIFAALLTLFISVMLEGVLGKYGLPYLTLPFLFTFWMVTLATRHYTELHISERGIYQINELYGLGGQPVLSFFKNLENLPIVPAVATYFKSLSAIFFQYHLLTGILVAIGLLYFSRIAFLLSVIGYTSAFAYYSVIGANFNELNYSFIGFNYILTAIAIGGFFIVSSRTSVLWVVLLTPLISILVSSTSAILGILQLSTFSLPFNIIVLLFIYALKLREKQSSGLEPVIIQEFSPERNLYSRMNAKDRFPQGNYVPLYLPVMGEWTITQGHSGEHTHRENWRHAWDFEVSDENGKFFHGKGSSVTDYYCFNKPVIAPADGWVEEIVDEVEDNAIGAMNLHDNWGNTLIIRHAETLFTKLSHLKKGSFKVKRGDKIKRGDVLAAVGNSGRSPVPHLHFQVQATPFIGSSTIDYPVSQYLVHIPTGFRLISFGRPQQTEKVSNIVTCQSLAKAFHFLPGQVLEFIVATNGKPAETIVWDVKADLYGMTYLECRKSGSKAWFHSSDDLFYFTWYEGRSDSVLFAFYEGAYKVAKGFYRNLIISDVFPLKALNSGVVMFLQDLMAPFFIFLKARYEMHYQAMADDLRQDEIRLKSSIHTWLQNRKQSVAEFEFEIKGNALNFVMFKNNKQVLSVVSVETKHD